MLAYLIALLAGVAIAIIIPRPIIQRKPKISLPQTSQRRSQLDTVDEMVLWGEVSGDDFYRMM